jgi:hypothetical protein
MTPERGGSKEGSRGEGYGGYISPPPYVSTPRVYDYIILEQSLLNRFI